MEKFVSPHNCWYAGSAETGFDYQSFYSNALNLRDQGQFLRGEEGGKGALLGISGSFSLLEN